MAVVVDGEGIDDESMQRFAHWTNLSETTFILPPAESAADYRVRIFTPSRELPFAGHPTLGSAHAWLEAGGQPTSPDLIRQECGAGIVAVSRASGRLAFAAPSLVRDGAVDPELLDTLHRGLGLPPGAVVAAQWVDNGPGWVGLLLESAAAVLAVEPDSRILAGLDVGLIGPHQPGASEAFEVRAFAFGAGVDEDPVTGSLNASLGQWLIGSGHAPDLYRARQGTRLGRHGVVYVEREGQDVWVGGKTRTLIRGTVDL